ncbi:MAG: Ig-like domain-containing protein, partial [Flavobacterium sp.]
TGSWPTPQDNGGGIDLTKYVQFKINPDSNHQLNLNQFNFVYRGASNQKFEVRYSKDINFATGVKVLYTSLNSATSWTPVTTTFPSDVNPVLSTETVYIRFYVYNTYNTFEIKNGNGNTEGPVITGTVKDINTLTANNDYISTPTNQATNIPVLTNDVIPAGTLQSITVTQPSNGTVTVNGLTDITFTPATGFTGTATFNYTIRNTTNNYSSATVTVTGTAAICAATPTAGVDFWKGYVYTYTGNTPAATTYVGTIAEKALFDRNVGTGVITGDTAYQPNAFCGTAPSDKFLVRYLMQTTTTAGIYNFTIGGDDGVRLYVDGALVTTFNPTNSWSDHSYTTYATQYTFTAGTHNFVLEYYENGESSRVSFSYGAIKGDTTLPYGDNKWNVYGFNSPDISLINNTYAGTYVATGININTQTYWNATLSPSSYSGWQGAPMPVDQFAITYKRQGFPCGRYQLQLVNCDDVAEVYIDGVKIFTQNGYTNTSSPINGTQTYPLNSTTKVEVRLREDGGNANVAINFTDAPFAYDGSVAPQTGSSIAVNSNLTLANDLEVCSCTIAAGKTLTIPADKTLTVNENITVNANGKLVIKNNGSLVQTNNTATYTGAADSFDMERISYPMKDFDYTYWSSAVAGEKLNVLSPNTLSDKYMSYSGTGWVIESGNTVMKPGKGYIIRVPKAGFTYANGKDYWTTPTYA